MRAAGELAPHIAGQGKDLAAIVERGAGSNERAGFFSGFDDDCAQGLAGDQTVSDRKNVLVTGNAWRKLGEKRSAPRDDLPGQAAI